MYFLRPSIPRDVCSRSIIVKCRSIVVIILVPGHEIYPAMDNDKMMIVQGIARPKIERLDRVKVQHSSAVQSKLQESSAVTSNSAGLCAKRVGPVHGVRNHPHGSEVASCIVTHSIAHHYTPTRMFAVLTTNGRSRMVLWSCSKWCEWSRQLHRDFHSDRACIDFRI